MSLYLNARFSNYFVIILILDPSARVGGGAKMVQWGRKKFQGGSCPHTSRAYVRNSNNVPLLHSSLTLNSAQGTLATPLAHIFWHRNNYDLCHLILEWRLVGSLPKLAPPPCPKPLVTPLDKRGWSQRGGNLVRTKYFHTKRVWISIKEAFFRKWEILYKRSSLFHTGLLM